MTYVEQTLGESERVMLAGRIHWISYIGAVVWTIIALPLVLGVIAAPAAGVLVPMAVGVAGVAALAWVSTYIRNTTTEFTVTSRRVVSKVGVIRRDTTEQRLSRVDSVSIRQSVFGRILNYGEVDVRGSGSSFTPMKRIENPVEFKKLIERAIDFYEQQARQPAPARMAA